MDTYSVEAMWRQFEDVVMPADEGFSATQRREMKRAFFAGCFSLLAFLRDVIGGKQVPEEQGVVMLERFLRECEAFMKREARHGG